eukprot:GHRR01008624.1.p1 GENE.GHRR01008624.1~~GHRR01008624.1.p1  ORF type:complete len:706 (+),score=329.59 GHRR01008624.1:341-2458(+)
MAELMNAVPEVPTAASEDHAEDHAEEAIEHITSQRVSQYAEEVQDNANGPANKAALEPASVAEDDVAEDLQPAAEEAPLLEKQPSSKKIASAAAKPGAITKTSARPSASISTGGSKQRAAGLPPHLEAVHIGTKPPSVGGQLLPQPGGLSPKLSDMSSSGGISALEKIRAARANAASAGSTLPGTVASTISTAKAALAKARTLNGLATSPSSTKVSEGVGLVSDKPFMLYGVTETPKPKPPVNISSPTSEESAKRKAWEAERAAMRERRLAQETTRQEREVADRAIAAAARAAAHKKVVEERKAKYKAYKAKEAELMAKSGQAWKQYQEQRSRPPLFKVMEDEWKSKAAAEAEAKRAAYEAEVAAAKLATVSQLVKGEVVIRPAGRDNSPGRSHSPGGTAYSPHTSDDHLSHMLGGRALPHVGKPVGPKAAAAAAGSAPSPKAVAGSHQTTVYKWPGGAASAAAAVAKQFVDRASSPLVISADTPLPKGAQDMSICQGHLANNRQPSAAAGAARSSAAAASSKQPSEQPSGKQAMPAEPGSADNASSDAAAEESEEQQDSAAEDTAELDAYTIVNATDPESGDAQSGDEAASEAAEGTKGEATEANAYDDAEQADVYDAVEETGDVDTAEDNAADEEAEYNEQQEAAEDAAAEAEAADEEGEDEQATIEQAAEESSQEQQAEELEDQEAADNTEEGQGAEGGNRW